jgi:hypothetical protein
MEPTVANDLLWGVDAIAKEIGQPARQVYWLLESGQLPAGKSGRIWVASRQTLKKHFQELTAKAPPKAKCVTNMLPQPRRAKKTTGMKRAASA